MNTIAQDRKFKVPPISVPLFFALMIGYLFDIPSKVTKIDLPVNSDRMKKLATATPFIADKIRNAGFVQRKSIDESVREMTDWYLARKNK